MSPISNTVAAVLLVALATAVTFAGIQTVRLADAKAAHETTKRVYAESLAENERIAREAAASNARTTVAHAERQAEIVSQYEAQIATLNRARRDDANQLARVRKSLAEFTDGGSGPTGTGDAPGTICADRLRSLGNMVEEGAGLLVEALGIVERQRVDIDLLRGLNANDRDAYQ